MSTLLEQMRDQVQEAVSDFPIIDSMSQLWDLPKDSWLLVVADDGHERVWSRESYFVTQGMSQARNGALWSGVARVLWIP